MRAPHRAARDLGEELPAQADAEDRRTPLQRLCDQRPGGGEPRGACVVVGQVAAAEHHDAVVVRTPGERRTGVRVHHVQGHPFRGQPVAEPARPAAAVVLHHQEP